MGSALLALYDELPGPLRSVAASLRGYLLRHVRYGPDTERLVAETLERDRWSPERWTAWREERLAFVLHRAATRVPYYRAQWAARRRRGDQSSWERLEHWPVLEKETVREQPAAFVADDCAVRRMWHDRTSGTTGKPLDLWLSRDTVRRWYALFEARARRWYGVSRDQRWAIVGGQLVTPVNQHAPPFWVWNRALRQLYVSSYHLAPEYSSYSLDALRRYRVEHVLGYTSSLCVLAQDAVRLGRGDLQFRVVVVNAEPIAPEQRELIGTAFRCPVRETYGMAELAAAASECPSGRLHLWPEVGHLEVLEGPAPAAPGAVGDLVCTGLLNADMPLVRYRVGDRGAVSATDSTCACGRTLPTLACVEGRITDMLRTRDGRRIAWFNPVFAGLPVREAQIIQEALDLVRVRFVPAPGFAGTHARTIAQRLQARLEMVQVQLEEVPAIPRAPNGKFRAVVCTLPADERAARERRRRER